MLEALVLDHLQDLFPGFKLLGKGMFRILRDSEVEIDEEAVDLVRTFETALKRRRRGHVIGLVVDTQMPSDLVSFLMERFDVHLDDMFLVDGMVGVGDVKQLISDDRPDLLFSPYVPRFPERIRYVWARQRFHRFCPNAFPVDCFLSAGTLVAMFLLQSATRTLSCTIRLNLLTWSCSLSAAQLGTPLFYPSNKPCTARLINPPSSRYSIRAFSFLSWLLRDLLFLSF
jgi:hypothetical protein